METKPHQIEIQLLAYRHLPERMVYTWCDGHTDINPPVSISIVDA